MTNYDDDRYCKSESLPLNAPRRKEVFGLEVEAQALHADMLSVRPRNSTRVFTKIMRPMMAL